MNAPQSSSTPPRMDRRDAIKWMMTAVATSALLDREAFGASAADAAKAGTKAGVGYGTDPDILKTYKPGDVWPLSFNDAQRATAAALCDVIIPADAKGPSASSVRVHEFIDEWISAPYPQQRNDRKTVLDGLAWIEAESHKRFGLSFDKASDAQRAAIADNICSPANAKPAFAEAAKFFARFRDLAAGGFYTTPVGMKDIGYRGNTPLATFEGPPLEALKKAGLV
jgi:hypothetical protein